MLRNLNRVTSGRRVLGVPLVGILAADILAATGTGDYGPGLLYDEALTRPGQQLRLRVTAWPAAGQAFVFEDGALEFDAPAGAYSLAYDVFADNVLVGSDTAILLLGVAPGAALSGGGTVNAGAASGGGGGVTAPGASLTGAGAVNAGAAAVDVVAPGAALTGGGTVNAGAASGGSGGVAAPGASLSGAGVVAAGAPLVAVVVPGVALHGAGGVSAGPAAGDEVVGVGALFPSVTRAARVEARVTRLGVA